MYTYIYAEKNGSGSLTIDAENEDEAEKTLAGIVKEPRGWRCDLVQDEDGNTITEDVIIENIDKNTSIIHKRKTVK